MTRLALLLLPAALMGCDLVDSVTATNIVSGLIVATPELKLMNRVDVPGSVIATSFVGQRDSVTSTEVPTPISDATVALSFSGSRVGLPPQGQPGTYLVNDGEDAALVYAPGNSYTFRAALPGNSTVEYGGTIEAAPNQLTPASIILNPTPTAVPNVPDLFEHPANTALTVTWPQGFGRYTYVSVLRADANDPGNPQLVYDNRPDGGQEILKFVLGTPPTEQVIPAENFAQDGIYVVILFALDRGTDLLPDTFLGSPILAGSGAPRFLLVGQL